MSQTIDQPKWAKVEYSKKRIEKAGRDIIKDSLSDEDRKKALDIIDNWRSSHAFPLQVIYMNLKRLSKNDDTIIVAQRLKRLDSIVDKLKRFNTMSLWNMQDLGGCRFIVSDIESVYKYSGQLKNSRVRHALHNTKDYIEEPKESGYRSLHIVYKYHSDKSEEYNHNMLIEVQFRTHLQHLWATAVETMDLFTNSAIKSGKGSEEVTRFFALTSSLFAIRENCKIVPNTPEDIDEIIHEIESLNSQKNYLDFLSSIRVITKLEEDKEKNKEGYCVLSLNYQTHHLTIRRFKPSEIDKANAYYSELEIQKSSEKADNVLVRVSSFSALKSAYPNYFSDISEFVAIIKEYLG